MLCRKMIPGNRKHSHSGTVEKQLHISQQGQQEDVYIGCPTYI